LEIATLGSFLIAEVAKIYGHLFPTVVHSCALILTKIGWQYFQNLFRDRCYDFKNIFAKKSAKNWRF
jgi:hypothetical protein